MARGRVRAAGLVGDALPRDARRAALDAALRVRRDACPGGRARPRRALGLSQSSRPPLCPLPCTMTAPQRQLRLSRLAPELRERTSALPVSSYFEPAWLAMEKERLF